MFVFMGLTATLFVLAGVAFMTVAAMGFVRLPDVFCRLHVTGVLDTLGAPLVLLGAMVWTGWSLTSAKLLLGLVFLFVTSPLVGHLLSWAALHAHPGQQEGQEGAPEDAESREEAAA